MRVTIIADASHCSQKFVGAYGFWAVSNRGHHAGEGVFKSSMKDSTAAEAMAIVNALHCTLKLGIAADGDSVLIQTDSLNAIGYFGRTIRRKRQDLEPIILAFMAMLKAHALKVQFRHVKGHSRTMDSRSAAQRHADKRAYRNLQKARQRTAKEPSGMEIAQLEAEETAGDNDPRDQPIDLVDRPRMPPA